jgi:hypothetical protein
VSFPAFIVLARGNSSVAATAAAIDWGGQSGFAYVLLVLCLWLLGCDFIGTCALDLLVVILCRVPMCSFSLALYQVFIRIASLKMPTVETFFLTDLQAQCRWKSFHVAGRSCYLVQ